MWCVWLLVILIAGAWPAAACKKTGLADYVGKYVAENWNTEGYVAVVVRKGILTWSPPMWMPTRQLVAVRDDVFQMEDRSERQIRFERDSAGCVVTMTMANLPFEGRLAKKADETPLALDLLLEGRVAEAFPRLLRKPGTIRKSWWSWVSACSLCRRMCLLLKDWPNNSPSSSRRMPRHSNFSARPALRWRSRTWLSTVLNMHSRSTQTTRRRDVPWKCWEYASL